MVASKHMQQQTILAPEFDMLTPESSELPRDRFTDAPPPNVKSAYKVNALIKKITPRSPPTTARVLKQKSINMYARDNVYISFNIIKIEPQDELEVIHEMEALDQRILQEKEYEEEMFYFMRGESINYDRARDPRLVY